MKITGAWLHHPGTQRLCAALTVGGHQALFVGGCVRNALLGVAVADIDLATDARPETVTKLAENAGFRVVPTGIDHGTVTVIGDGIAHEVTTFRRDVATDGRRAVIAFSDDIAQDALRRDLTMNALYAAPDGRVIDPLGGLSDLLARQVRFVGVPSDRIREDYLRILRFFRFHAHYGDPQQGIDAEGLAACAALADWLVTLSRERIGAEMRKLLAAADPAPAIAAMQAAGVLARILPGADGKALAPLVHLEAAIPPRWQRRLAVLGGQDVADRLRLSRVETLDFGRIRDEIGQTTPAAELAYHLGPLLATDTLLARAALLETPLPPVWQADIALGAAAHFPVAAADLMPALQGPALGQHLKQLELRWMASGFRLTKADLLR